jgi:hypothetical protein
MNMLERSIFPAMPLQPSLSTAPPQLANAAPAA